MNVSPKFYTLFFVKAFCKRVVSAWLTRGKLQRVDKYVLITWTNSGYWYD